MKICRLQTFCSAGEVFKLPGSDAVHVLPMQLMRTKSGMTVLRIGDTTYWWDENGAYDGPEMKFDDGIDDAKRAEVVAALESCKAGRPNSRPRNAYFDDGSPGHEAEVAGWPPDTRN